MTFLAYAYLLATMLFFGGLFFGGGKEKRSSNHYGFLLAMIFVMGFTGCLMALGVLGLLPELVW